MELLISILPHFNDVVTPAYIDGILKTKRWSDHGGDLIHFIEEELVEHEDYDHLQGLDIDSVTQHDDFRAFLLYWLGLRYNYVLRDLERTITSEEITIYRALYLTDDEFHQVKQGQKKEVGIYWGTEAVQAWNVDPNTVTDKKEYLITATVNIQNINWHETLISRFDYSNGDEEQEINLKNMPLPTIVAIN